MFRVAWLNFFLGLCVVSCWNATILPDILPKGVPGQSQTPASEMPEKPAGVPESLSEAESSYRRGDFDHAIQKYKELLQEKPNSPDAYAGLTRLYLKKKDVGQAYETVTKGLQVADSPPVRVALGEVYFRQGKIPEAEREWVNVINSGHQDAHAYVGLARVRWAVSLHKGGWTLIEKARQLDPTDPEIRRLWTAKLSRPERVNYLEEYLASETNDDAETRSQLEHYLEYLKARAQDPWLTCHLVSQTTTTDTKLVRVLLDLNHVHGYGLSVVVNGQKFTLLLDTGASGITIHRGLAEKAGVTKLYDTDIGGIGDKGSRSGYIGLANSIKIGDLELQGCPVAVLEQRSVVGEQGLIGPDIFSTFLVDIDFPNEKLHLRQLPERPGLTASKPTLQTKRNDYDSSGRESPESTPHDRYIAPEMKTYTQVYRFGQHLLVPTLIGDAPVKLFLVDTGALNNLISLNAAREISTVRGDPTTTLKGISGSVKHVYRADKAILRFGHMRQENQDLIAFDLTHLSDRTGTEISGILGFAMLRLLDIKIDYRDGLVDFRYDPKRRYR